MAKYVVAVIILALFSIFASLSAAYCAWLTAIPLTPQALHKAQFDFCFWLVASGVTLILLTVTIIRMVQLRKTDRGLHR